MKKQAKTQFVLTLDQGTTGSSVSLVNSKGQIVHTVEKDFKQHFPKPGWVEHEPEDIWNGIVENIKKLLQKSKIKASQIAGIGITNQRETIVAWDSKTGKSLHRALVWQDRRTQDFCLELKKNKMDKVISEKTGLVIDPYFSASKIRWLLKNSHKVQDANRKKQLRVGTIDSFLISRLSSNSAHVTDVSNASRTQLVNIKTADYDSELLKLFEVPREILPQVVASSDIIAYTKSLKFLPDGIPISGVAGDQQAALFGQNALETGDAKCTFGTGSFLLMNSGSQMIRSSSGLLTTIAWKLGKNADSQDLVYALEGGAFICGAAVQFLRDQLGFIKSASEIEALAKKVKSSEGVEFVPALTGLGAPYWLADARGLICGMTRGTSRAHIARATLEAMALQNVEILLAMQKDIGAQMHQVRVDGGASANNLLMQLQSDYLGCSVIRPKQIETTSLGASYLAGLGVGLWSLADLKKIWKEQKRFEPQIDADDRQKRLEQWRRAVDRCR